MLFRSILSGSKKMLVFDDTESTEKIRIYDKGADLKDPESFDEFQLTYRSGDVLSPRLGAYEPLSKTVEHFVECVRNGKKSRTDGIKGVKVIKVLEAIDRSLKSNGHIQKVK